jgi:hypothetical protein
MQFTFHVVWIVNLIVMGVLFLLIGVWINKKVLGILIDGRNRMSLGRLQLVLWSWLLISAFVAVAVSLRTMDIWMAPEIWALMGISVGSTAGGVIVKGTKAGQEPSGTVRAELVQMNRMGILAANEKPSGASLRDLFKSEELTDCEVVDISKVQMFFFTLATVGGYTAILWNCPFELDEAGVARFPAFSASLTTLLGISHAGYLTVKAAPKTPTA